VSGQESTNSTVMNNRTPVVPSVLDPTLGPVSTDEGALRAQETDLRLATHLRALSRVSLATAHDVRTPLHTIILYLELLRNTLASTPDEEKRASQERFVEVIGSELQRLEGLLEKLFSQTRVAEGKTERFDLAETVRDLHAFLEPYRRRTRIESTLTAPEDPILIEGDRDAIRHALVHILITAVEGTEAGGKHELHVAAADGRATFVITGAAEAPSTQILDGSRADPPKQAASGAERGLYVARRVVERHGGSIHVRTGAPGAATLEIRLPLAAVENR